MEIDYKSVAKNPRKKTSQQVIKIGSNIWRHLASESNAAIASGTGGSSGSADADRRDKCTAGRHVDAARQYLAIGNRAYGGQI
jgi:hypothetical protein